MPELRPRAQPPQRKRVARLSTHALFCAKWRCIQVGFLSEIRARAGLRTIFETSNLDACDSACTIGSAQAPRPFGGHRENVRSGNRLPATAFNKAKLHSLVQFMRAVRNSIQGQFGAVRLIVKGDCNAVGCLDEYSNYDVNRLRNSEFDPSQPHCAPASQVSRWSSRKRPRDGALSGS